MYKNYSINEWTVNEGDFVDYPPHSGGLKINIQDNT